jgi:hypothetical protein
MRATWPAQTLPKFPEGTVNRTCCVIRRGRLEIPGEVVHDLRHQARPVDRVDRADAVAALEIQVADDTTLTMSWQSSNTPSTAMLWMLSSIRLNICACWNGLMRPAGWS